MFLSVCGCSFKILFCLSFPIVSELLEGVGIGAFHGHLLYRFHRIPVLVSKMYLCPSHL